MNASRSTPNARPKPIERIIVDSENTNPPKTETMIRPAAVTTDRPARTPRATARQGALVAETMIEGLLFADGLPPLDTGDLRRDLVAWLSALFEFVEDERNEAVVRSAVAAAADNADVGRRLNETFGAESVLIARLESGIEASQLRPDAPLEEIVNALIGAFIVRLLTRVPTVPGTAARLVDVALGAAPPQHDGSNTTL